MLSVTVKMSMEASDIVDVVIVLIDMLWKREEDVIILLIPSLPLSPFLPLSLFLYHLL